MHPMAELRPLSCQLSMRTAQPHARNPGAGALRAEYPISTGPGLTGERGCGPAPTPCGTVTAADTPGCHKTEQLTATSTLNNSGNILNNIIINRLTTTLCVLNQNYKEI